jgi:hypothetical protein
MTSTPLDMTDFSSFAGSVVGMHYQFPTITTQDTFGHTRVWTIQGRLIKKDTNLHKEINWNPNEDTPIPFNTAYLEMGSKIPDGCIFQYWTENGILDGKITRHEPSYVSDVANEGRANERNIVQTGLIAMRRIYEDHLKSSSSAHMGDYHVYPMLAQDYRKRTVWTNVQWPMYVGPKINGVRGVSSVQGIRTRDQLPILGVEYHQNLLNEIRKHLPENSQIDFEFYKAGMSLQKISGAVRSSKSNKQELECWIFDYFVPGSDETFDSRYQTMQRAFIAAKASVVSIPASYENIAHSLNKYYKMSAADCENWVKNDTPYINCKDFRDVLDGVAKHPAVTIDFMWLPGLVHVPNYIAYNRIDAEFYFRAFVALKYEGAMLRIPNAPYTCSTQNNSAVRSRNLLKWKILNDDEYPIVGYTSGTKGRDRGALLWICEANGNAFNVTPKGMTIEARKVLYNEFQADEAKFKNKYLGALMTIQFDELSTDGVPQRAKALNIRTEL